MSIRGVVEEGVSDSSKGRDAVVECGRECLGVRVVSVMCCVSEFIDESGLINGMIQRVDVVDGELKSVECGPVKLKLVYVDW